MSGFPPIEELMPTGEVGTLIYRFTNIVAFPGGVVFLKLLHSTLFWKQSRTLFHY